MGLSKPWENGSYSVRTPNDLLLGRSSSTLPDDSDLVEHLGVMSRYRIVHHVTTEFWKKWCTNVSAGLVVRQKWHEKSRNLCVGDLVMICELSIVKSKYKLGVVDSTHPSVDGLVRSVTVRYVLQNGKDKVAIKYVKRSVQRLVLVMPVEELSSPVVATDHGTHVQVHCESGGVVNSD